jgi:hypothetical protein
LLLVLGVSACSAPAIDAGCAGFRPVLLAGASIDYLAASDPQALAAMIGNHEMGQARGCWR